MIATGIKLPDRELFARTMEWKDVESILEIEKRLFPCPWNQSHFSRADDGTLRNGLVVFVRYGDIEWIAGYMVYAVHAYNNTKWNHIKILKIGVAEEEQYRGVGRALLYGLKRCVQRGLVMNIVVSCSQTNAKAQLFFEANGFHVENVCLDSCCKSHPIAQVTLDYVYRGTVYPKNHDEGRRQCST